MNHRNNTKEWCIQFPQIPIWLMLALYGVGDLSYLWGFGRHLLNG